MENSGKQNPESGFKSPPEHIVRIYSDSKWLQFKQLRHESFYVKNITHNCSTAVKESYATGGARW